ncbi:helix-turn-helix transcriptional regulator [Zhouia spongiae]|uniref:Helix-turn-helix transcriptional regulator n=1 Tax=Zhouia spongiae TaxID=2202721 RepID=A0ABY3YPY4_9FLAO|nr:helix-turn-helix transcriptional regulator [Zhouia spongiae]UNY99761.1 helix-turn-helix transcriptional regulator [Zhouia spongiae]
MNRNSVVGTNIKLFREQFDMTQETFSNYLGITREEVSYYENGKRTVPLDILKKAADFFGVDEYILFEENRENLVTDLSFAFRADDFTKSDMEEIAKFKKIVKNYVNMKNFFERFNEK